MEDDPDEAALAARYLPRLKQEMAALGSDSASTSDARRPVELDQQSVGRLSRMDALQDQAMAQAQEGRRAGRTRALEAAIRRIETGEFGWCSACGDFIGARRLELDPTLMRCRDCAG